MVVSGIVWRRILDQDTGVLNTFLDTLGPGGHTPWLTSPGMALLSVILVNIWIGIPFNLVILYGGLQEIPKELYEAASLDGASAWRAFRSVTLPMLKPVITVVLVLGFMSTVKILDLIPRPHRRRPSRRHPDPGHAHLPELLRGAGLRRPARSSATS